jgi:hypothetical protein
MKNPFEDMYSDTFIIMGKDFGRTTYETTKSPEIAKSLYSEFKQTYLIAKIWIARELDEKDIHRL